MDTLDSHGLGRLFARAGLDLKAKADELSAIDSRFGDGDHGVTMSRIGDLFLRSAEKAADTTPKTFLDDLGVAVMAVSGGSAGPLWGTLIGGLALPLDESEIRLDAARVVAMLGGAQSEMEDLSTARVGDKTMMDALIPAVDAARQALAANPALSVPDAFAAAARGAREGAKASENFVAKYGRAKSYKEQTLGTPDAGATSLSFVFQSFADAAADNA